VVNRQVLQQALRDTAELDIDMVGAQFSADRPPILNRGSMQILFTRTPA